jgi:hypothetical protein
MQVNNIFSSAYPPVQQTAASDRTTATAADAPTETASTGSGVSSYDFTSITPKELQSTINNLVKSGKLSLKDSSPLVTIARFGDQAGKSDQQIDVFSALKAGIAFKEQSGQAQQPNSGIQYWNNALSALQGLQGTPSGVDTYA